MTAHDDVPVRRSRPLRRVIAVLGVSCVGYSCSLSRPCAAFLSEKRGLPSKESAKAQKTHDALPEDVANAVSATAAESLLMGMFVLICSFELRGVKAGVRRGLESQLRRDTSFEPLQVAAYPTASLQSYKPPASSALGGAAPKSSPSVKDDDIGSIYGTDDNVQDTQRQEPLPTMQRQDTPAISDKVAQHVQAANENWQINQLVLMMILLHVIYPSFPISPQVELGRIMTFLGFLWSVGPQRCIAVVNTEPVRSNCRLLWVSCLGAAVAAIIFIITDTISDLIFPLAASSNDLYHGPRYLHQLLVYLKLRYPVPDDSFGPWAAWFLVSAVVFSSAVWKEFLFRGVYFGGLRTRMPFWAANMASALIFALAHEPIQLATDGSIKLHIVACAPLMMGAMWYGYLYHISNNLIVTVLAHLMFNSALFALHLNWS
eukprot:TRINITY_DN36546_c0_g1_i1.p1 TRINITY_DN36546_c0_g1~~TRINITY_DN36546_c0_g1_i1.p1  ORF type:complete len:431 (-),score=75.07 TRINITY_DN36546_c0_g1_i1:50-1342(-)